ncbi:MAG: toprim domain-containing protein [Rhodobacteraceae bacterium]|nr:toprim domain-containing protein [Paracoccaceae bacterium]
MTWVNFQTVRQELDFNNLLAHYGFDAKANGKQQVKIHCPFHEDANPSCGINLAKKVFHCFSCQAKGNILDFFAMMEGLDPSKTQDLRKAALLAVETFGIYGGAQESRSGDQPKAKQKQHEKGQKQRQEALRDLKGMEARPDPEAASQEVSEPPEEKEQPINAPLTFELKLDTRHVSLRDRSIPKKLVEKFGLGYAKRGTMAGRICFPIHNQAGELIAYSGRWVDGDLPHGKPRYLLPKGFEKSRVLYNLNRVVAARAEGRTTNAVVIVEGFWSVLRLHTEGVPVVSTFGDSVSDAQIDLLVQAGVDRVVLIFDGDDGGRKGSEQALPVLASRLFVKTVALADGVKPDTMSEELVNDLPRYVRS